MTSEILRAEAKLVLKRNRYPEKEINLSGIKELRFVIKAGTN